MLNIDRCSGIAAASSLNPAFPKGSEPSTEGSTAKVLPPEEMKLDQYRLLSARPDKYGVKFPRYASLFVNALPRPSTRRITMFGRMLSFLKKADNTSTDVSTL